ncbi:MAG: helix-turn-helix domain-containing protein [Pirellula sp.]|jgi:transcriptional regulator with XRE-family HTH domain|nr:helix-turn-helix domain-containing protein [Pirellula sp.]
MAKRGVFLDGELLTKLYTRRGWSQQEFASHAGLDARTISKIKRGGSCDARTLQVLSATLKVLPESLLAERDTPDSGRALSKNAIEQSAGLQRFRLLHHWKVIDLRGQRSLNSMDHQETKNAWRPGRDAMVWNSYRIVKLDEELEPYLFPFLTWGDGIDCEVAPSSVSFRKVDVSPGDLAHSDKQWEIVITPPDGEAGTVFDCGPIGLRYVDAFFNPGQQWWQTRITDETDTLLIQVWFDPNQPCKEVRGEWAAPGGHRFHSLENCKPQRLPDGTVVTWMILKPVQGSFYKISWAW